MRGKALRVALRVLRYWLVVATWLGFFREEKPPRGKAANPERYGM